MTRQRRAELVSHIFIVVMVLGFIYLLVGRSDAAVYGEWGITHADKNAKCDSDVKFVEFGHTRSYHTFEFTQGVGGWADATHAPGTRGSLYVHTSLGLEPHLNGFYLNYQLGPAYITSPDSNLASNFQVHHELGFGLHDVRGVRIGVVLKHFSNGGMVLPNKGRNFVGLRAGF